jgi:ATP-dependent RNA helicase DDX46/PRP5
VTNLRRVTMLVLDEADRMFDMGFEPQVMKIADNCRPDKQIVMFSATFPRQMEALARRVLSRPIEVQVGGRSVVCKDIEQKVHIVEEDNKFLKLLEVLGQRGEGLVIIFVDKQEHADSLLKDLMNASYTSCGSLHGGIDQYDRDSTITNFKSGKLRILVATSVCARGLDVKDLVLVVNYDCPNHYEDYVHRCGRTGRAGNQGYAHTLITPEQGRYGGEVLKALELSDTIVPQDLRDLWNSYKAKQAEDGKTVKSGGGGFGGSGFKFDESEASYTSEKKKFQKTVFGLQDSDDEDVEQEIDDQIEALLDPKRSVKTVTASEAAATGLIRGANTSGANTADQTASASDKLEAAKRAAAKINLKNNPKSKVQQSTESYMAGKQSTPLITAKTVADHLAAKLNAKLNYQPSDEPSAEEIEAKGGFQKFEEELIINDFPQQARWRVTSKEALAQISEYSDAGITVRGTYFPPGKPPPEGDRKLFLAIESTNELSVQKAKVEITRLLKEELMKMQTSGIHHINKGRYKVL